jgi:hypothetical protein
MWAPVPDAMSESGGAGQRRRASAKVRKCTGASSALPRLAIAFAVSSVLPAKIDPSLNKKQPRKGRQDDPARPSKAALGDGGCGKDPADGDPH